MRRTGYLEDYEAYADRYGVALRTVKRWVAKGKEVGERCPLDDAEGMRVWWSRWMIQKCPEKILSAAVAIRKSPPPVVEPPVIEERVEEDEKGLEKMIGRLLSMEVKLSRVAQDPGGAKPWLDTISRTTSVITKLREEKEKLGALVPKDIAEAAIHEFHGPIENGVRGIGSDFCRAAGLPWGERQEAAWAKVCDELFKRFGEEVFRGI